MPLQVLRAGIQVLLNPVQLILFILLCAGAITRANLKDVLKQIVGKIATVCCALTDAAENLAARNALEIDVHLCAKILTVARDAKEKNVPTIATVTTAAKNVLVLTALLIAMATIAAKNVLVSQCSAFCDGPDCGRECRGSYCARLCEGNGCGDFCIGDDCAEDCKDSNGGTECGRYALWITTSEGDHDTSRQVGSSCGEYVHEKQCIHGNSLSILLDADKRYFDNAFGDSIPTSTLENLEQCEWNGTNCNSVTPTTPEDDQFYTFVMEFVHGPNYKATRTCEHFDIDDPNNAVLFSGIFNIRENLVSTESLFES